MFWHKKMRNSSPENSLFLFFSSMGRYIRESLLDTIVYYQDALKKDSLYLVLDLSGFGRLSQVFI